ncbi:hypothetical protein OIM90_00065 [Streptomyces sp. AD16]|nr:hypothetical protein OIM90_00065 [Streptomyces sp. AD16]
MGGEVVERGALAVGEGEGGALRREPRGDRPADAPGRARDEDVTHQWNSLFFVSGIVT